MTKHIMKTTADFNKERMNQGRDVSVINLGCARNLVDSQTILNNLKRNGHRIVDDANADIVYVNTCAFIDEAKRESIDTILELLERKRQGKIKKVIVAGCLAQRYNKELSEEFEGIDAIIGTQKLDRREAPGQVSLTPGHTAYVKISESCYNQCRFCIIPKLKGKFTSRTVESVVEEIRQLDARGVKEINLIGQDITAYGMDIYREFSLARLLKAVVAVTENVQWIRLLYAFPAHVTDELIDVIAQEEKICKYIDMPLQHISDRLLKSMNRNITTLQTNELITKIRDRMPGASLRTTFIVGLPGETEDDFNELLEFIENARFEKAGAFVYSREEGTAAYDMPDQVPAQVKKERLERLMTRQREISRTILEGNIGRTTKVLIEERQKGAPRTYLGRTEFDAPEVDGLVYVNAQKELAPGEFADVLIKDAYEYDLVGDAL